MKLDDPEAFFRLHGGHLVCLDEVQQAPEIFQVLRSVIDEDRQPGRFLILGSASVRTASPNRRRRWPGASLTWN